MSNKQCKGFTKEGFRCKNKSGSSMCYCHSKRISKKSSKKTSKKSSSNSTSDFCKKTLKKKISINIHEKRWASPKQAIAVSYSQVKKWFPKCRKYLER